MTIIRVAVRVPIAPPQNQIRRRQLVHRSAISHSRLMRESTDRIQVALHSDDAYEYRVAQRLAESSKSWELWEYEHSGLMRQVADYGVLDTQAVALRHTALRLIHGKALFEYLRRNVVRGPERARIMNHFYPTRGYQSAVIAEHCAFVRKACSYLCATHVGSGLVHDPAFLDPMQHYESLYSEYFDLYCSTLFPRENLVSASERSLLPLLKHQLNEWRWIILNPRQSLSQVRREREIRRPTGDTQQLPRLKVRPRDAG
jgi:hypothetical protein